MVRLDRQHILTTLEQIPFILQDLQKHVKRAEDAGFDISVTVHHLDSLIEPLQHLPKLSRLLLDVLELDCEYCSKVSNQQLWKKLQEEESAGEQVRKLEQDVSSHLDGSPTLVNLLFVDRLSRERDEHRSRWGRTLKTLVMTLRRVHTLHSQRLEFLCSPDCRDISSQLHHLLLALKESCQWLNLGAWETGKLATSAEGDVGQAEENEEDGEEDVLLTRLGSWAPREKSMKYQGSFMSFVEDTFVVIHELIAPRGTLSQSMKTVERTFQSLAEVAAGTSRYERLYEMLSTSLLQGLFDAGSVVFHMLQESHRLRATLEFRVQSTKALHSDFSTMYDRLQDVFHAEQRLDEFRTFSIGYQEEHLRLRAEVLELNYRLKKMMLHGSTPESTAAVEKHIQGCKLALADFENRRDILDSQLFGEDFQLLPGVHKFPEILYLWRYFVRKEFSRPEDDMGEEFEKDRDVFASIIPEPVESDTVPNSSVPSSSDALHLPPEDVEEEQGISSNAGEGPSGIHHNYEDEASTFTKEQYEDELACHRAGTEEEEMGVDSLQRCLSQSEPPPTELGTPKRRKDGNWDIPDGILNSGLLLRGHRLEDYTFEKRLGTRTVLVMREGMQYVLKSFVVATQLSGFINEIWLLHQLNHRTIQKVDGFIISGAVVYIRYPFHNSHNLIQFCKRRRAPDRVRLILRSILEGLAYLHTNGIVHTNLSPENVVLTDHGAPIIIGFEYALRLKGRMALPQRPIFLARQENCAPELLAGDPSLATYSSDIFSFGLLVYRMFAAGSAVVSRTPSGAVLLDWNVVPNKVKSLVSKLVVTSPESRLPSSEILVQPLFVTSAVKEMQHNGYIISKEKKLRAVEFELDRFYRTFRRVGHEGREDVRFYVRRSKIVSMVLPQVPYPFPPNYSLDIEFLGEAGIDAGGLTTDFFKQFFSALKESPNMFEYEGKDGGIGVLPIPDSDWDPKMNMELTFRRIGVLLGVCLTEKRLISVDSFPSTFFKFLLHLEDSIDMRDLEIFDPNLARGLRALVMEEHVDTFLMDFGMAGGNPKEAVTDSNKFAYAKKKVKWALYKSRMRGLSFIREAFWNFISMSQFDTVIRMLNHTELAVVFSGAQEITAEELIRFCSFRVSKETKELLCLLFHKWEQEAPEKLFKFVEFVTGLPGIPSSWDRGAEVPEAAPSDRYNIVFSRAHARMIPVAHLCFWSVDIFDEYPSLEELEHDLDWSLENIEAGFFIA